MVLYYGFAHRSVKWWKRVFFHLLDLTLVNSHILYKAATSSRMTQLGFRLSVAKSLIEGLERPSHRHHAAAPELPLCLTERAFPKPIPNGKRADGKCVAYVERGNVTRRGMGASRAIQPCAYTPVLSAIIHSNIIKSLTSMYPPAHCNTYVIPFTSNYCVSYCLSHM